MSRILNALLPMCSYAIGSPQTHYSLVRSSGLGSTGAQTGLRRARFLSSDRIHPQYRLPNGVITNGLFYRWIFVQSLPQS